MTQANELKQLTDELKQSRDEQTEKVKAAIERVNQSRQARAARPYPER